MYLRTRRRPRYKFYIGRYRTLHRLFSLFIHTSVRGKSRGLREPAHAVRQAKADDLREQRARIGTFLDKQADTRKGPNIQHHSATARMQHFGDNFNEIGAILKAVSRFWMLILGSIAPSALQRPFASWCLYFAITAERYVSESIRAIQSALTRIQSSVSGPFVSRYLHLTTVLPSWMVWKKEVHMSDIALVGICKRMRWRWFDSVDQLFKSFSREFGSYQKPALTAISILPLVFVHQFASLQFAQ